MSTAIYTTDSSIDSLLTAAVCGAYGVRNQYDSLPDRRPLFPALRPGQPG